MTDLDFNVTFLCIFQGKAPADDDDVDDGGGSERTESDDDNDRDMSVPYNVVSRGGLIIRG